MRCPPLLLRAPFPRARAPPTRRCACRHHAAPPEGGRRGGTPVEAAWGAAESPRRAAERPARRRATGSTAIGHPFSKKSRRAPVRQRWPIYARAREPAAGGEASRAPPRGECGESPAGSRSSCKRELRNIGGTPCPPPRTRQATRRPPVRRHTRNRPRSTQSALFRILPIRAVSRGRDRDTQTTHSASPTSSFSNRGSLCARGSLLFRAGRGRRSRVRT